jgi:hypothetical protein
MRRLLLAATLVYVPTVLAWITGNLGTALLDGPARLARFVPILLLQLLTSGLGEEPGWGGFLLPPLAGPVQPSPQVWLLDWRGRCGTTRSPRSTH